MWPPFALHVTELEFFGRQPNRYVRRLPRKTDEMTLYVREHNNAALCICIDPIRHSLELAPSVALVVEHIEAGKTDLDYNNKVVLKKFHGKFTSLQKGDFFSMARRTLLRCMVKVVAVLVVVMTKRVAFALTQKLPYEARPRPRSLCPTVRLLISRGYSNARGGPEPPVDVSGLQMRLVAAVEVTQSTRGPNFAQTSLRDEIFEHLIFSESLHGYQVHALLPAQVSGVQPTDLVAFIPRVVREEVVMPRGLVQHRSGSSGAFYGVGSAQKSARMPHSVGRVRGRPRFGHRRLEEYYAQEGDEEDSPSVSHLC